MVQRVGSKLVDAVELFMLDNGMASKIRDFHWEFSLIEDAENKNAFVMPGGKVVVYTGLLPITKDEGGLAAVLGHEIAHAIVNHGGERMSHMLLVELGGLTLSQALSKKPEKTQEIWMLAYGAGTTLGAILPYSRTHENEADHVGLIIMAMAGYHPEAAIGVWERMAVESKGRMPEFLSTHPSPETRIKRIREELPEAMTYYKKG